jgi:hypothetical protein
MMKDYVFSVRTCVLPPVLFGALLLAACAPKSYCLKPQKYDHVASIPPITGGDGLNIPTSTTALVVPPPPTPDKDTPFGSRVVDPQHPGTVEYACLDEPPPMPAGADPTLGAGQ